MPVSVFPLYGVYFEPHIYIYVFIHVYIYTYTLDRYIYIYIYEVLKISFHRLVPKIILTSLLTVSPYLAYGFLTFFLFSVSGNLSARFPSEAVGETVAEL